MGIRGYRRVLCGLLCLQFSTSTLGFAQTTPRQPLGALTATGEVYVNGTRVTGESTIFVGDELRTGAGGAASITASERGVLVVNENTQLSLVAETRYFGTLQQGSVRLRAVQAARSFQLRTGIFVVAPVTENEAVGDIARAANGAVQVKCLGGSIAVIELEGPQAVFLFSNQSVDISADGKLGPATTAGSTPQPPTTPPAKQPPPKAPETSGGGANKGVIVGVVAAAGAGAALALGRKSGRTPISP